MLVYKVFYIILLALHAAASSHDSDSTAQSPSPTACVNAVSFAFNSKYVSYKENGF